MVLVIERLIDKIENSSTVSRWGDAVRPAVTDAVGDGRLRDALTGRWLGHPVHPANVILPLSCWMGATVLDVIGGRAARGPAQRLIGAGVVTAFPAMATGAADWLSTRAAEERVGTVHALTNQAATALYATSWLLRRAGRHDVGRRYALAGTAAAGGAAFLGGHLSYRRGVGVNTTAFDAGPTSWSELELGRELDPDQPVPGVAGGAPMVAVRSSALDTIVVLEDRCSHRGAPLHEGTVEGECVVCPWHSSRFHLRTGAVEAGPASAPQPAYDVRLHAGRLEVERFDPGALRNNAVTLADLDRANMRRSNDELGDGQTPHGQVHDRQVPDSQVPDSQVPHSAAEAIDLATDPRR